MTLPEWFTDEKRAIEKFIDQWPDNFPQEMEAGDWDEQFSIFRDTDNGV